MSGRIPAVILGAGGYVGRYLLVPAFVERQQNGTSGAIFQRLNGLLLGLPPDFWLDASDPENTGLLLPPNVGLLQDSLEAPEALQTSLGLTQRLGKTGKIRRSKWLFAIRRCREHTQENLLLYPTPSPHSNAKCAHNPSLSRPAGQITTGLRCFVSRLCCTLENRRRK